VETLTFKVKSNAVNQSVFLAPHQAPGPGQFVPLVPDGVGLAGSINLPAGTFVSTLVLSGGQPGSAWGMTIQRNSNPAIPRAGRLDGGGNDGDVVVFTIV
jgi:hypothetical protein